MGAGVHPRTVSFCLLAPRAPYDPVSKSHGGGLRLVSRVSFKLELTTPACPIKDEFERKARDYVSAAAMGVPGAWTIPACACPLACHACDVARMEPAAPCGSCRPSNIGSAYGLVKAESCNSSFSASLA